MTQQPQPQPTTEADRHGAILRDAWKLEAEAQQWDKKRPENWIVIGNAILAGIAALGGSTKKQGEWRRMYAPEMGDNEFRAAKWLVTEWPKLQAEHGLKVPEGKVHPYTIYKWAKDEVNGILGKPQTAQGKAASRARGTSGTDRFAQATPGSDYIIRISKTADADGIAAAIAKGFNGMKVDSATLFAAAEALHKVMADMCAKNDQCRKAKEAQEAAAAETAADAMRKAAGDPRTEAERRAAGKEDRAGHMNEADKRNIKSLPRRIAQLEEEMAAATTTAARASIRNTIRNMRDQLAALLRKQAETATA